MNGRNILRMLVSAALGALMCGALLAATPAWAQFPDVLSAEECPGCRAAWEATAEPRLAGVWSSPLTAAGDSAWRPEDFACFIACTPAARERASAVAVRGADADRDAYPLFQFACDPRGLAEQVVSPLPLQIDVQPGRVVLRYEEFGVTRSIPVATRGASRGAEPTPLGVSSARFEGDALVIETKGIAIRRFYGWLAPSPNGELEATERYTTSPDGAWLDLTLELFDSEARTAPLVVTKRWRRVPGVEIARYGCDVMSGELEGVFAEYVDPARVDEHRIAAGAPRLTAVSPQKTLR
jgi:hypothetical protein